VLKRKFVSMPHTSDVIAQKLYDHGCRYAFGIPGGEVLTIMDALVRIGINFFLAKHENAAGFMAEGVHHATGAPVILLATLGPGVANAVNVIVNAFQDQVPLIVLTGCVDAADALTYTHQIFDHQAMLRPITKASFRAVADQSDILVDKAVALALEGRPGPVHIDLPVGIAGALHRPAMSRLRGPLTRTAPAEGPLLDEARALFQRSVRPTMVIGIDAIHEPGAGAAVRSFAERFQIPFLTTYKAKGIVPEDHPLCLGGHGLSPLSDRHVMPFLAASDCIIALGYDPIETRSGWKNPWDPGIAIEFAAAPNSHDMHHSRLFWTAGLVASLDALAFGATAGDRALRSDAPTLRKQLKSAFSPNDDKWGPRVAIDTIQKAVPRDTVITADSGAHRILLSQQWEAYRERGMLQSSALCTMGSALPLAIGYQLASSATKVVAFMGDAGLEMVLGELATLRDRKLPIIVCVFVDASLTLIEMKQRSSQLASVGVNFGVTDFAAVARALGGHGAVVNTAELLKNEIKNALQRSDGYTLIAIDIGPRAYDGQI
jgi:acetolactate synthase I/II/III large subunit